MKITSFTIAALLAVCALPAAAQTQSFTLGGPKIVINQDQKLMLDAAQRVMHRDYAGAEVLYSQVIALNNRSIEAYLQRGVVRRELGNAAGVEADATAAVNLATGALQANPNDPLLYYQRGMGFRLLKNYTQAKQDVTEAIRRGGKPNWQTDLQAITLEEKTGG